MTNHDSAAGEAPGRALPISNWAVAAFIASWVALFTLPLANLGGLVAIVGIVLGHVGRRETKAGERQDWQRLGIAGLAFCYFLLIAGIVGRFIQARRGL